MKLAEIIKDIAYEVALCDTQSIPYYHKSITFADCGKLSNDTVFAEYYILNTTDNAQKALDYMGNIEKFYKLQDAIIGDRFFSDKTDLKFNLYLIIIVESMKEVSTLKYIQTDFHHIRKVVLDKEKADKFFDIQEVLARKKTTKCSDDAEYLIEHIKELSIDKYKIFQSKKTLEFQTINLFSGDNGAGKTAAIEAIVSAITQTPLKKAEISLTCENQKGEDVNFPNDKPWEELYTLWYRKTPSNQSPLDLFFNHNYCSMEDSAHFVIEGRDVFWKRSLPEVKKLDEIYEKSRCLYDWLRTNENNSERTELAKQIEQSLESVKKTISQKMSQEKRGFHAWIEITEMNAETKKLGEGSKEAETSKKTWFDDHKEDFDDIYLLLTGNRDYAVINNRNAKRANNDIEIDHNKMSVGQTVCYFFAQMFTSFISSETVPNFIILDEPIVYLDPMYTLSLIDVLRQFAIRGTQIFFSTHNPQTMTLFRRKFSFFRKEFREFYFDDNSRNGIKISMREYNEKEEAPVSATDI